MKIITLLLVLASCSVLNAQKITGISLEAPEKKSTATALNSIKQASAKWIGIIPFGYMEKGQTKIRHDHKHQWWGETTEGTIQTIKQAKSVGLNVMLKPQLWIKDQFVGHIDFTESPVKWAELEKNYTDFILKFARIADSLNVEILSIGCEFKTWVVKRPKFWNNLIDKVRAEFKGKLTYSANWDNFGKIRFWSRLDYIGVDAYFPMSDDKTPSVRSLIGQWNKVKPILRQANELYKKPILFTEYGFRSVDYNMKHTWDSEKPGAVNQAAQKNAYEAFFKAIYGEKWFAGGFLWKWHINHANAGGKSNNRFTPQNKTAQETISHYFNKANTVKR